MEPNNRKSGGFAWLELLLVLAALTLAGFLFPGAAGWVLHGLDPRHWTRAVWLGINVGVILALVGVRFRREFSRTWRSMRSRRRTPVKAGLERGAEESESDYEARLRRDAEWRERAKKRLPFT